MDEPTLPGACLGTGPSSSIIKEKPEEDAVFYLRKAAGGERTASVNGLPGRFWREEPLHLLSSVFLAAWNSHVSQMTG